MGNLKNGQLLLLQRLRGWPLALIFSIGALLSVEAIVAIMDLILKGAVLSDDLLIGLIATGLVAPLTILLVNFLLVELFQKDQQQLKSGLSSARAHLSVALESADEGILMVNKEGVVLATNPRFLELWSVPPELAATGQDKQLLVHVLDQLADPDAFLNQVMQLYSSDKESRDTLHFKDGRVFARYSRTWTTESEHGRIWCFKDISEQKRFEESLRNTEQELRTILDNVDAYIYLKDTEGRYLFANRAVRELWHAEMEDVIGFGDEKFFDPPTAANIRSNDQRVLGAGETLRVEETNTVSTTGKTAIYQSTKLPLRRDDGRIYALCGISIDITFRKQAENALRESEETFRRLFNETSNPVLLFDLDEGKVIDCNQAVVRFLNYEMKEDIIGLPSDAIVLPIKSDGTPSAPLIGTKIAEALRMGFASFECQPVTRDGERRDVAVSLTALTCHGKPVLHALWTDISARRQAEARLQLAASVFTHANEAILITTADGTIIDTNDAFTRTSGYQRNEVIGKNPNILSSGRQDKAFYADMWQTLQKEGRWLGEIWNRRKDGEIYATMLTISAVCDEQNLVQYYVGLSTDITALKEHETRLERIAHYDALTNLPNRVLLADRLHQSMALTQRRGQRLAVAYLDLDGFKAVNDTYGHDAGDQLLISISAHMKAALREGDTLARIGGDEFVIVLPDLDSVTASTPLLVRLLAAAAQPVPQSGQTLQISASLGVTFYPQAETVEPDQLLRQADQAMYQAKLAGKNRYHIFDAENDRSIRSHHESIERIRQALTQGEFVLHYQPKVNMRLGTVIGAEALIRWQHPERGLVLPGTFLPAIENHPLAVELGEWVIDAAITQMEYWQTAGLQLPVSVNIGARQLQQPDFAGRVRTLLAKHPTVSPTSLELEVLETSALEDIAHVTTLIEACRELGVGFALDDFGTGYSSLSYFKRLPINVLKIDQSFVRDMLDDPDDLAILEGILGLALAFRREVIAEGVETTEQGELLLQLGCELAQGYGIARPMPATEIPVWMANWQPHASWRNQRLVSRKDLPLIFAGAEHRAWIAKLKAYLQGQKEAPPMDHHRCHLGHWLESEGKHLWNSHPDMQAIDDLHRQLHAVAIKAVTFHAQGRTPDALALLAELHNLSEQLLNRLKQLAKESQ